MNLDKKQLEKLRKSLKRGSIKRISEKSGFSRTTIYNVLDAKYGNDKVINACIEEAQLQAKLSRELADKIEQVSNA